MLGHTYRFVALNSLGQTIASSSIVVTGRRLKFGTDGTLTFDSESTEFSFASTLAANGYAAGATRDNSTGKWVGGSFVFAVTAPASAAGDAVLYLQHSTDGGTTWPDNGLGQQIARLNFATSGTKRTSFFL